MTTHQSALFTLRSGQRNDRVDITRREEAHETKSDNKDTFLYQEKLQAQYVPPAVSILDLVRTEQRAWAITHLSTIDLTRQNLIGNHQMAEFTVIKDGNIELETGGTTEVILPIPVDPNVSGEKSVISYLLKAKDPKDLKYEISIKNNKNVTTTIVRGNCHSSVARTLQEVIPDNILTNDKNKLIVKVISGDGALVMSDIVLWYKLVTIY